MRQQYKSMYTEMKRTVGKAIWAAAQEWYDALEMPEDKKTIYRVSRARQKQN